MGSADLHGATCVYQRIHRKVAPHCIERSPSQRVFTVYKKNRPFCGYFAAFGVFVFVSGTATVILANFNSLPAYRFGESAERFANGKNADY